MKFTDSGGSNPGPTGGSNPGPTGGSNPGPTGGTDPTSAAAIAPRQLAGNAGATSVIAERRISFGIERQQQSDWCWAAVAVSVERYFDPASTLEQCEIANKVIPKEYPTDPAPEIDSCDHPEPYNKPADLKLALEDIHKWRTTLNRLVAAGGTIVSPGTLTFEAIRQEIDRGRPICAAISWYSGGGHFVVLSGYRMLGSGARQVYVQDPLNPSALVDLDEFSFAYYGDGEWTATHLVRNDLN